MHVSAEDFELYLLGKLPLERSTEVVSHVADCQDCGQKLDDARRYLQQLSELSKSQHAHPSPQDQRRHHRIPTDAPALIKLIHPSRSEPLVARILDVSKEGLKVRLSHRLLPGVTVEIQMERTIVFAEVRYCIEVGGSFEVGVQIQDVIPRPDSQG
jgi:hypothetical protein